MAKKKSHRQKSMFDYSSIFNNLDLIGRETEIYEAVDGKDGIVYINEVGFYSPE